MKSKIIYLSWLIAMLATTGSLYFSNIMELPPCSLCWWQRIGMFPLVLLFAIGFLKKDQKCYHYTTPLVIAGFVVSLYHNLLYYGFIEKSITACTSGLSCTSKQIEWFGFVTIPLLSLMAYTLLFSLTLYTIINNRNSDEKK